MLIRFLPHGRGSGQKAANYLLGKRDHRGTSREEIRILVGNPEADARLIDNLTFRNRYSSGVIAWAPEDRPTDEQVMAVLDDFEKVAFAGLQDNQYTWSAVLHRERGGGVHVHVVVPMVELQSGKSFNVAPPGWHRDLNPVAEMHNFHHGWARPDDPARRRLVKPGPAFEAKLQATAKRGGISEPSTREEITEWLVERIGNELVENRDGIRASLAELGTITRETDTSISVRLPEAKRAIRLKGLIYEREFTPRLVQDIAEKAAGRPEPSAGDVRRAEKKFRDACERRRQRNLARYRPGIAKDPEALPETAAPELVHRDDGSRIGGDPAAGDREHSAEPGMDAGFDMVPRPEWGGGDLQGSGRQPVVADEQELATGQELDMAGQGRPVVCQGRMKGVKNGRKNRHRAGLAGPDWQDPEGLGRAGSPLDRACTELERQSEGIVGQSEDFECSVERLGRADQVLAGIARAIGAIRQAIRRRLKMLGKEREKRPDGEWENPFSLDLKPPRPPGY